MSLSLSKRAASIVQAEIRAMSIECEKVGGINLAQGVCDTEVPLPVRRAAQDAIEKGQNSYTRYDGVAELREAIAGKMRRFNKMNVNPETGITVSAGSTGALYCAFLALLNPGDEVIVFEPYYGYHINTLLAVEVVPKVVTLDPPSWGLDHERIEEAVSDGTRGIIVNSPANPSGKVFTRSELEWIGGFAERHDLFIFTDEIYEFFVYDGLEHVSPGAIPGLYDRTITISGYSKTFSITGWRIGYSVASPRWAEMIGYMNDLVYVCAPSPLQFGVQAGIDELGKDFYDDLSLEYQGKRDRFCDVLKDIGLSPAVPQGAYYVLADVGRLPGETSKEKAMHLLLKTGVASVPGDAFYTGSGGRNLVRFCFAKADGELDQACQRLRAIG